MRGRLHAMPMRRATIMGQVELTKVQLAGHGFIEAGAVEPNRLPCRWTVPAAFNGLCHRMDDVL